MFNCIEVRTSYRNDDMRVLVSPVFYGGAFVQYGGFSGCVEDMPLCDGKREVSSIIRASVFNWRLCGQSETQVLGLSV